MTVTRSKDYRGFLPPLILILCLLQSVPPIAAHAKVQVHSNYVRSTRASSSEADRLPRASSSPGVEQVHLQPVPEGMTIVWATQKPHDGSFAKVVHEESGDTRRCDPVTQEATSQLVWYREKTLLAPDLPQVRPVSLDTILDQQNTSDWAQPSWGSYYNPKKTPQWDGAYYEDLAPKNPNAVYTSPVIHTAICRDLEPGAAYAYEVGSKFESTFRGNFTLPPAPGEEVLVLGVWGDVGQTRVSLTNMEAMRALDADLLLLVGDYSYSDGYGPLWDVFGRLMEPLLSEKPMLGVGGNHEVDSGEAWVQFNLRYPQPWKSSGSVSPLWYSYQTGPAHIVGLNSYSDFSPQSLQYEWLASELQRVDRLKTPWLIVMFHTPWYTSNKHHFGEGLLMQEAMEDLLYEWGVDIVLNGHVHNYERTHPVYRGSLEDPCAPVYAVIGDGGNHEGAELEWYPQPEWSAYRESSFGIGELTISNSTHARWTWHRRACPDGDIQGECSQEKGHHHQHHHNHKEGEVEVTGKDDVLLVRHRGPGRCQDIVLSSKGANVAKALK